MQKWIQHVVTVKLPRHSGYTEIITQICESNNFCQILDKCSK
jgi:pyridoxal/pyridoxine/pyridoxamine kinase